MGKIWVMYQCPVWIKLFHKNPQISFPGGIGKRVFHRPPNELERMAFKILLPYVEQGITEEVKYRPTLNDAQGPFAPLLPPMCVFSTEEMKAYLQKILYSAGMKDIYWQSNEDTRKLHETIRNSYDCPSDMPPNMHV